MKAIFLGGLVACMPLLVSTNAQADGLERVAPDPAELAAERMYQNGVQMLREGRFANAVTFLEGALPMKRTTPDVFFNLVQATRKTEQWGKLVLYAQGFLAREQEGSREATAIAQLQELTFDLVKGWGKRPSVVKFDLSPVGTEVFVNGVPVGDSASEIRLLPGKYVVSAEPEDYIGWRQEIVVAAGDPPRILRRALVPRVYKARVKITTSPAEGVEVFLDEVSLGVTPLADLEVQTGKRYLFRFHKDGYDKWVRYVQLGKDEVLTLAPHMEREAAVQDAQGDKLKLNWSAPY